MWKIYITTIVVFVSLTTVNGRGLSPPSRILQETDIVIIGAGASGIAAAARLLENGINNFIILEAESRYGGRIDTVRFGEDFVDLGAHWIHGERGNVVFNLATQYQLLTNFEANKSVDALSFIDSSGNLVNISESALLLDLLENIDNSGPANLQNYTKSAGAYYNEEYTKALEEQSLSNSSLAKPILEWYEKAVNIDDGADSWFQTSGHGYTEYKRCEGSQTWTWTSGGYFSVFDLLMKRYPDPVNELPVLNKINYISEVSKILWNNLTEEYTNKVIVECKDGTSYLANMVMTTVSLAVLKEREQSMFQPVLPASKLNAIRGLSIGTVDKIFMKFPYKWWPDNYSDFGFLWPNDAACNAENGEIKQEDCWDRQIFTFGEVDNLPLILYGWVEGPAARYMEQLSDEEVKQKCVQLLNKFIGKAFNITVPAPDLFLRSMWSSNPHFRGSYSFRSMETEALGASAAQLADPVINDNGNPVLLFAGEATHSSHYSTVHGAIESGWREAERIVRASKS